MAGYDSDTGVSSSAASASRAAGGSGGGGDDEEDCCPVCLEDAPNLQVIQCML